MSKKRDPEDIVVAYFTDAPVDRANLLLTIVKGIVKRRTPPTEREVKAVRTRKPRTKLVAVQDDERYEPVQA